MTAAGANVMEDLRSVQVFDFQDLQRFMVFRSIRGRSCGMVGVQVLTRQRCIEAKITKELCAVVPAFELTKPTRVNDR